MLQARDQKGVKYLRNHTQHMRIEYGEFGSGNGSLVFWRPTNDGGIGCGIIECVFLPFKKIFFLLFQSKLKFESCSFVYHCWQSF